MNTSFNLQLGCPIGFDRHVLHYSDMSVQERAAALPPDHFLTLLPGAAVSWLLATLLGCRGAVFPRLQRDCVALPNDAATTVTQDKAL
eukprot:COSAG02_NODE_11792_length_1653_cov_1.998713_2_plen_88_part_00